MKYAGIIKDDIANGTGIRTSLFVSGCRNNCPGCFNKDAQNFNYGEEFNDSVIDDILDSLDDNYHDGLTLLGGDPMEPENAEALIDLIYKFRKRYHREKTLWVYSGYIYEDIISLDSTDPRKVLLLQTDVLVDGPFIESLKDISLKFRGSSNQRIIDCNKSCKHNVVILGE